MTEGSREFSRVRIEADRRETGEDRVAVEEPLQIRVEDEPVAVLMRTPGQDHELVVGFLLSEGWIDSAVDVLEVSRCSDVPQEERGNVMRVRLLARPGRLPAPRTLTAGSGCGVCGRATIEDLLARTGRLEFRPAIPRSLLASLEGSFQQEQRLFQETGGVHAAALFDASGTLQVLREDVGRHNAVDKVTGWALTRGRDRTADVMMVSSRAGFEVVQKACRAGIPAVVCVGAATSLAIELAREVGLFLVAFHREGRSTVYARPEALTG